MPITTTSSMQKGGSLSSKIRCWDCNKTAPAFLIESTSGNQICGACAEEKGLSMPIIPSEDPVGTIERRGNRGGTSPTP